MKEVIKLKLEFLDYSSGPILASKVYVEKGLDKYWSVPYYYKLLERACKSNALIRLAKGVYCYPKHDRYDHRLTDDEVVELFTANFKGVEVGEHMFHEKKVMFYESDKRTVFTSELQTKEVNVNGVHIIHYDLGYYPKYAETIQMLEVLKNYYKMGTVDHTYLMVMYTSYCHNYDDGIARKVIETIGYPKSTVSFLHMILESFHIPNTLGELLSKRSVYKHPTIEEISRQSDRDRRNLRRRVIH